MFKTIFIEPLYNFLVFLINVVPWHDVGLAIIVLTLIVKLILSPLHKKAIIGQYRLKQLEPKINELKKQFPDKKEQAAKSFELYKEHNINPFSGCLPILIQLPIILALYRVFMGGFDFSAHQIYSFVTVPEVFNLKFLGLVDLSVKSLVMSVLAGVSQFFQAHFSIAMRDQKPVDPHDTSLQANMSRMMGKQTKYILPIFIAFISYQISAAIALYWTVNNIFTTFQEIRLYKQLKAEQKPVVQS